MKSSITVRVFTPILLVGWSVPLLAQEPSARADVPLPAPFEAAARSVAAGRLKEAVDFLAAPERGGRIPGSPGHREARDWVRAQMARIGLEPLGKDGDFLFPYPSASAEGRFQRNADGAIVPHANDTGCDIIGRLRGADVVRAEEHIVLLAHYDHLGVTKEGVAFAGAFDDAAGVAALLEVARALKGAPPKRSVLFLVTDDEENGLRGARAWLDAPTVPLDQVVLAISADPLGRRIVPDHGAIVVAGAERSPELLAFWRGTTGFAEHDVVFVHRNLIRRFNSDHDCFYDAKPPIPAMWLVNPGMSFYHKTGDTPETIDYRILTDSARYLVRALAHVGNSDRRFAYVGPPPIGAESARDARVLLQGLRQSKELSEPEQRTIALFLAEATKLEAAGRLGEVPGARGMLTKAMLFLFQLAYMHPGPIPPPFPLGEGETPMQFKYVDDSLGTVRFWVPADWPSQPVTGSPLLGLSEPGGRAFLFIGSYPRLGPITDPLAPPLEEATGVEDGVEFGEAHASASGVVRLCGAHIRVYRSTKGPKRVFYQVIVRSRDPKWPIDASLDYQVDPAFPDGERVLRETLTKTTLGGEPLPAELLEVISGGRSGE